MCGIKDRTGGFDLKHILKRWRSILISETRRLLVCNGIHISRSDVKLLLRKLLQSQGKDTQVLKGLFDPKDKQNVSAAVRFLTLVSQLKDMVSPAQVIGAAALQSFKRVLVLGAVVEGLLAPIINLDYNILQLFRGLARTSALLFTLYRKAGKLALPTQLYHDTQAFFQTTTFNILKMQMLFPGSEYHIFLQGTDTGEREFSSARTLTHNRNFDALEASIVFKHTMQIRDVFMRNEELDRGGARLKATTDHINPR
jgi:hypothetical protein